MEPQNERDAGSSAATRVEADAVEAAGRACFALQAQMTARALSRAYDAALRPIGLRSPQFGILSAVALGVEASETALAARLGLERTTLVRNVKLLERRGWIEPNPGERRGVRHRLTDSGRATLNAALPLWHGVQRAIETQLGPDAGAVRHALQALRRASR